MHWPHRGMQEDDGTESWGANMRGEDVILSESKLSPAEEMAQGCRVFEAHWMQLFSSRKEGEYHYMAADHEHRGSHKVNKSLVLRVEASKLKEKPRNLFKLSAEEYRRLQEAMAA